MPIASRLLTVEATNLADAALPVLLLGISDEVWNGMLLPLDLGAIGFAGCPLLCSGEVVLPVINLQGRAIWSVGIPNLPGGSFFNQFVVLETDSATLCVSNAARATIGY